MIPEFINKKILMILMGIFIFFLTNAFAQSNDDCLMCHDDDTFTMDKDGNEVSIYVNGEKFHSSSHSNLKCVSCHTNS